MKKSQILAAIALAMALGVVAPVVSAENASAVTEPANGANGKATVSDANKFKASVEGSKQFKAVKAIDEKLAEITAASLSGAEVEGPSQTAGTLAKDIADAYASATRIANAPATIPSGSTLAESAKYAEKYVKNYTTWVNAINLIARADANAEVAAAETTKTTLKGYYETLMDGTTYTGADTYAGVKAAIENNSVTGYTAAAAVVDAVADGNEVIKFKTELQGVLNSAKANGITGIGNPYADGITWAQVYGKASAIKNAVSGQGKAYGDLVTAFAGIPGTMADTAAGQESNYNTLEGLLDEVATLYGVDVDDLTVSKIVAGYVAPVNPADPADGKDDVNAPATGIAGTAEGTATTVSIVAGLATALTALGAGVVAYRSARRK